MEFPTPDCMDPQCRGRGRAIPGCRPQDAGGGVGARAEGKRVQPLGPACQDSPQGSRQEMQVTAASCPALEA